MRCFTEFGSFRTGALRKSGLHRHFLRQHIYCDIREGYRERVRYAQAVACDQLRAVRHDPSLAADIVGRQRVPTAVISQKYGIACRPAMSPTMSADKITLKWQPTLSRHLVHTTCNDAKAPLG